MYSSKSYKTLEQQLHELCEFFNLTNNTRTKVVKEQIAGEM